MNAAWPTYRRRFVCGIAMGATLIGAPVAHAQPIDGSEAPIDERFRIGGPEVEVELELRAQGSRGQDDDDTLERDVNRLRADLVLDLRQRFTPTLQARAEFELRAERASDAQVLNDDERANARVRALFVQYETEDEGWRVRLGRQSLEDEMGWFIDEDVDALRIGVGNQLRKLDLSVSRQAPFDDGRDQEEDTVNALAALSFDVGKKSAWTPWLLHRSSDGSDDEDDARTTWLGLQGVGRTTDRLRYWFNAAVRRGEERRDDGTSRDLAGHAVDLGFTRLFQIAYRPSVTLGWAMATGDARRRDGDDGFRQSGLHDNEHDFGGKFAFRYLGEVLDPELTNIGIATVGIGAMATPDLSFDLVYHHYTQREPDDRLRGTDLGFETSGDSGELGDGLDLIVGFDAGKALELQAIAGLFRPGDAFATTDGASRDDAWLLRLEMEYTFEVR